MDRNEDLGSNREEHHRIQPVHGARDSGRIWATLGVARLLRGRGIRGVLLGLVSGRDAFPQPRRAAAIRIVVFDSQVPIDTGQGVYMAAIAEELTGAEVDRGIGIFSRSSLGRGGSEWKREDVEAPSSYRLYRATATEHSVLDPDAHPVRRIEVML
jgi:hypothetical protein